MPKLEALCDVPFGVGIKPKGSQFEATDQEAALLVALKRARIVAPAVAKVEKVAVADTAKADTAKSDKHSYKTRDMKAGK